MPIQLLPKVRETTPVVPAPKNGSNTVPPLGQPAFIHGIINAFGKVAKCAAF